MKLLNGSKLTRGDWCFAIFAGLVAMWVAALALEHPVLAAGAFMFVFVVDARQEQIRKEQEEDS